MKPVASPAEQFGGVKMFDFRRTTPLLGHGPSLATPMDETPAGKMSNVFLSLVKIHHSVATAPVTLR